MIEDWKNTEEMDLYEIYDILPKINCRRCGEETCLAFASMVESGTKKITQCRVLIEKGQKNHE